jgi:hypothetical protein
MNKNLKQLNKTVFFFVFKQICDMFLFVPHDQVTSPGTFLQPVNNVHILLSNLVALVVRDWVLSKIVSRSLRLAYYHVLGDAPFSKVIKYTKFLSEREG